MDNNTTHTHELSIVFCPTHPKQNCDGALEHRSSRYGFLSLVAAAVRIPYYTYYYTVRGVGSTGVVRVEER